MIQYLLGTFFGLIVGTKKLVWTYQCDKFKLKFNYNIGFEGIKMYADIRICPGLYASRTQPHTYYHRSYPSQYERTYDIDATP